MSVGEPIEGRLLLNGNDTRLQNGDPSSLHRNPVGGGPTAATAALVNGSVSGGGAVASAPVNSSSATPSCGNLIARSGKPPRLSKQDVVFDEEDSERVETAVSDPGSGDVSGAEPSRIRIIDVTQRKCDNPIPPIEQQRSLPPSGSSKPKLLVRSHALCGDDDTRMAVRYVSAPRLNNFSRSSGSSYSFECCHDMYTDSTGTDLHAFIASTLHKNAKDRQMLLQLEQHMRRLVNDPARHSQKFPAMSSYNRMLVHRVAAYFGLDHNVDQDGTAVVVNKTNQTRIPAMEFSSMIQGDVYTDEPRRFLRRDAQSYEESGHCLGAELLAGRRAHSFEASECSRAEHAAQSHQLATIAQLHMPMMPQQDSASSTDASSTHHLLESPGSCYSYGEVPPYMGVYSPSDGNAPYGGAAVPTAVYPWSSSDSYASYSSSADLSGGHVVSPVVHSPNRPPLLTKCVSVDGATGMYKASVGVPDQRPSPARRNHSERHRTEVTASREPSIPEHSCVLNAGVVDEQSEVDVGSPAQPPPGATAQPPPSLYYAIAGGEHYSPGQYVMPALSGQPYAAVPPYVRYITPSGAMMQSVAQQMDALRLNEGAELIPSPVYAYQLPPQAAQPLLPQQIGSSPQMGTIYANQPYFVPMVPQGYVLAGSTPHSIYRIAPMQHHMARPNFDYSASILPEGATDSGGGDAVKATGSAHFSAAAATEQF